MHGNAPQVSPSIGLQRTASGDESLIVIIMGVSGSGKTTVGQLLARNMGCELFDADDYHSPENKAKMHSGVPLTDEDRQPWLKILAEVIREHRDRGTDMVLACSALKESYRKILSDEAFADVHFVYLKVDFENLVQRLAHRKHEFMSKDLLASQLETLEEPRFGMTVDGTQAPEEIVETIRANLGAVP